MTFNSTTPWAGPAEPFRTIDAAAKAFRRRVLKLNLLKLNLLGGLLVLAWCASSGASEPGGADSVRRLALEKALIELKAEFKTKTGSMKDPDKLMLEGLRTTALTWSLAAEFSADSAGETALKGELAGARADFERLWPAEARPENRMLISAELYYKAVAAQAVISSGAQRNQLALAHLANVADEVRAEVENSVYAQRKTTIYMNALALRVMPVLIKLKASPQAQALLDREIALALREAETLAARTDIHLRGKFFLLYVSGVRLLVKSSFLLAEDPNLGLTEELGPIKEVWQNAGADQNDPAGLAVAMGALTLTSLPLAYGLACQGP